MLVTLLALLAPAQAFAPGTTYQGIEPNRVVPYVASTQTRLRAQPSWRRFVAGEGAGWTARFDPLTGTVLRASGPGLPFGDTRDARALEKSARAFLTRNTDLLGVPVSDLRLKAADHDPRTGIGYVEFDRLVDGVAVWNGGVTLRTKHDKLVLFGVSTYPDAPRLGDPVILADEAVSTAMDLGPAPMADHLEPTARLLLLPLPTANDIAWHLAWEVRTRTFDPPGKWVSFVDAQDGTLLHVYNEVRFLDGVIQGTHDTRTVNGATSTSPMPLMTIRAADGSTTTSGADGAFRISGDSGSATLRGSWLIVGNQGGRDGSLSFSGTATPTWTTSSASIAEIDTFRFLHDVHVFSSTFAPDVGIHTDGLTALVNLGDVCNAYYDGNVNFFEEGGGCNNSGRIADVEYHEWGHGLHYTSLVAGTFDGSISEGIGDVTSAMMTLDPLVAPYFTPDGGYIRRIDEDRVYPDDVVNEVHEDGLIYAGAAWDLFGELAADYGESTAVKGRAWTVASQLFTTAMRAGPTLTTVFDEYVVADDDDGDLSNGSPHTCAIIEAFARHGLGPSGGAGLIALEHVALGNQAAGAAASVDGAMLNLAASCTSATLVRAEAVYSVDGGATWNVVPLDVAGEDFSGALPAFEDGRIVQYFVRAETAEGDSLSLPAGGEIAPYTFYVGELQQLYCEDFDGGDGGYSHELVAGRNQEGADDWAHGAPGGMSGDPDAAWSGRRVWGNDLGGGNYNGAYQSDITNRLTSAAIDVTGHDRVIVQYRRWLNVEDGIYDAARVYGNDAVLWDNHATSERIGDEHTEDADWIQHTLEVAPGGDSLTLGWEIESDGGLEFGGWNVDSVCVYAPAAPLEAAWRVTDFDATDDELGQVRLSWTQPEDARATWAVVVRRDDRFGEGRDDGEVVFTANDVSPGQEIVALDVFEGEAFYAVYTGDGVRFVTGAEEGANADEGRGLTEEELAALDEGYLIQKQGCGCATGSGGSASVAGLLAVGAALAGRRRRT